VLGIATVFQDLALCDNLDVVANLWLGREITERGVLQKIEQALTEENFARIEKGWSAEQVRRLLGKPASEVQFPQKPEVVREWRIDPVTPGNSAWFHVHFGLDGLVTGTSRREESPVG